MRARGLLHQDEVSRLEAKIAAAEARCSAQIKVAIAGSEWLGLKRKARRLFESHGLHQTAQRNCVLVLLVVKNRQLLIYGDEGVHRVVGQGYWDEVRERMVRELRAGRAYDALAIGVQLLGDKLAALFPAKGENQNEISNQILFVA